MNRTGSLVLLGLLVMLVAVAGCSGPAVTPKPAATPPAAASSNPAGTEWVLTGSSASSTDLSKAGITARFEKDMVSGFSGVNQYSGPCVLGADGSMKTGPLVSTKMAGPEPLMRAESLYLELFAKCDSYKLVGTTLTLSAGGNEALTYEAGKPATLPDSSWDVVGYNNGKQAVVSVSLGSTMTLDFGTDGTVSGDSGVNTYSGPFSSGETSIEVGPLTSTRKAGPEDLMQQEVAYLTALQNATKWEVVNGRLELRDASGALQVNAIAR